MNLPFIEMVLERTQGIRRRNSHGHVHRSIGNPPHPCTPSSLATITALFKTSSNFTVVPCSVMIAQLPSACQRHYSKFCQNISRAVQQLSPFLPRISKEFQVYPGFPWKSWWFLRSLPTLCKFFVLTVQLIFYCAASSRHFDRHPIFQIL